MDILSLRIFLAIHSTQNISNAASAMFLTQPTVSRKLLQLEEELGTKLVFRSKGHERVFLTTHGERFVTIANSMLELYDEALKLRQSPQQFHLRITAVNSVGAYSLAPFFQNLLSKYTDVQLTISHQHSLEICELLENRSFDIGIAHMEAPYPDLSSEPLFQEDYCIIHRAPNQYGHAIHPAQLDPAHLVYQHFSTELDCWVATWWPSGQAKIRLNNTAQLFPFFLHPLDWCIMPLSVALAMRREGFYVSYFTVPAPQRQVWLITRKSTQYYNYPVVVDFTQRIRAYAAEELSCLSGGMRDRLGEAGPDRSIQ